MEIGEFVHYNYIGEFAGLLMAGLLLFVMLYTKPKRTFVYRYVFNGIIWSIFSILVQISIIMVANNPDKFYNRYLFMAQLLVFLLLYNGILYYIFSYVNMMSIVRRQQRKEFLLMYIVLSFLYLMSVAIEIASRGLYHMELDGIDISHFTRFYCSAGIICALVCFNASITNRKNISRVIWHAVCLFVPMDLIMLVGQIVTVGRAHTVFSATTYVPIFALGYLMFHSVPYDEVTGCQSVYALDAFVSKNTGRKRYYISYLLIFLPGVEAVSNDGSDLILKGIAVCRAVEAISPKIRMYKMSDYKYVNILDIESEEEYHNYCQQLRGIFDNVRATAEIPFNYVMVNGEVKEELEKPIKVRQFFEFLSNRFKDQNSSHFYLAKPEDYDEFAENYEITETLKDIRNRLDLNDDRVHVYAQPIYSVDTGSFRVAEALMRLKIGDRLVSPDRFISVAESTGCIHALTCIILNKVCEAVLLLSENYDFDAISINCSSKELSQENMNADLIEIIEKYDIDTTKIRLEITESAMFENYEMAKENMNVLTKAGIQFYLDDFGTGYSSLERVINCPFKTIKFDKSLLYKSLDDNRMDDIMTYMIEVFKKNGFVTLVEGVEDESQNQYSMERGFDYIQGYHYAKPEPIEEMRKYFNRKSKF
ncbi:EAL domain-containing protein [Butyrivibrio sp. MC2021]|uniref:EAL domain-containing protein n=1 Tax=Butyrivibrio sp. MC2021 TaxID=1408306 RepID=UPI00047B93DA|nr:EAL domain-containing protein [Butyrivibrio sp. MC2021]